MPGGKDSSFCSKLLKGNAGNPVLSPIKKRQDGFTVSHFAGIVPYSSERFLTKNRDLLSEDCVRCLSLSENDLVVKLIDQRPVAPPDGQRRRSVLQERTVTFEFQGQVRSLMTRLNEAEPHFIKCVKPNPKNAASTFESSYALEQLRRGGMLQAIRASRTGYPVRMTFDDLWKDYGDLAPSAAIIHSPPKERAMQLLELLEFKYALSVDQVGKSWAVGKSLVFLKSEAFATLEGQRESAASPVSRSRAGTGVSRRQLGLNKKSTSIINTPY